MNTQAAGSVLYPGHVGAAFSHQSSQHVPLHVPPPAPPRPLGGSNRFPMNPHRGLRSLDVEGCEGVTVKCKGPLSFQLSIAVSPGSSWSWASRYELRVLEGGTERTRDRDRHLKREREREAFQERDRKTSCAHRPPSHKKKSNIKHNMRRAEGMW